MLSEKEENLTKFKEWMSEVDLSELFGQCDCLISS
jgi:hypothetical protein